MVPHDGKPQWEQQPDGSRVRFVNGIRIIDRTGHAQRELAAMEQLERAHAAIEHLVALQEPDGQVVILGLDPTCRPVYRTVL
jgi:hypothetical protein